MSWAAALCSLYDKNAWRAGEVENWNGKPLMLIPIGFDTMEAQIEITIAEDGKFINARALDKTEAETLCPYPEGRTSGEKAHPLFDKLIYVAGDYQVYVADDHEKSARCHQLYVNGLSAWYNSQYVHPKVQAIRRYILENSLIADLIRCNAFTLDTSGQLDTSKKIQGLQQSDSFVRLRVVTDKQIQVDQPESANSAIWLDKSLHKSFLNFYLTASDQRELCYMSGNRTRSAKMSLAKIRNKGDQTKLISSNDGSNFTYRGRFNTKDNKTDYNEALSIGFEPSQKAINALKWIIRRQGYTMGGACIVAWESDLRDIPQYFSGANEILHASIEEDAQPKDDILFDEPESEDTDTNYASAKDFNLTLDGYAKDLKDTSQMVVLALDSTTI